MHAQVCSQPWLFVAVVVNSSAKVANTAVMADLLGVLEFLGDFPAKEVDTAVGVYSFGALEFVGKSAVVVTPVAVAALVAAVAAVCRWQRPILLPRWPILL